MAQVMLLISFLHLRYKDLKNNNNIIFLFVIVLVRDRNSDLHKVVELKSAVVMIVSWSK